MSVKHSRQMTPLRGEGSDRPVRSLWSVEDSSGGVLIPTPTQPALQASEKPRGREGCPRVSGPGSVSGADGVC